MDELFKFRKDINDNKDSLFINNPKLIQKLELSSLYGYTKQKESYNVNKSNISYSYTDTFLDVFDKPDKFYNSEFKELVRKQLFRLPNFKEVKGYIFSLVHRVSGNILIMESPNILMNTVDLINTSSTVSFLLFLKIDDINRCLKNNDHEFDRIILQKNFIHVETCDLFLPININDAFINKTYFKKVLNNWFTIQIEVRKSNLIP